MRHILVGLWKEARDQRTILLALLVVLPLLVLTVGWAFGDQIPRPTFAAYALFVMPIALALFLIAVASELFGGERRRGTLDFARRLPRGLVSAFAAKLAAYVTGSLLFAAWGWCVAFVACVLFGPADAPGELLRITVDQPDFVVTACCLALVALGVWILLVSTWISQGGAAVLGAGLLLGLIALPAVLAVKESWWLLNELKPRRLSDLTTPLAVFAGVPLLVLGLSFLRGNRFLSSAWAPAWRGLSLLAVFAGGGYALGASALEEVRTIDPFDRDFRIAGGCVGVGGRYAYVNVHRGWLAWTPDSTSKEQAGTPYQPWIVDLETGAHRRAGDFLESWLTLPENRDALQPIVRRMGFSGAGVTWVDAATTVERTVQAYTVRTPETLAWEREALATLCWNHDAQGRGLWFEGETLVREGDPLPKQMRYRGTDGVDYAYPIPGGWWRRGGLPGQNGIIEASTGKVRLPSGAARGLLSVALSPTHLLTWRKPPLGPGAKEPRAAEWRVHDLDHPEAERVVEAPAGVEHPYTVLQDGRVMVMAGEDPSTRRLVLWAPLTGEITPVLDERGEPVVGRQVSVHARVPGDVLVISVMLTEGTGTSVRYDRLLLNGKTNRACRLTTQAYYFDVLAIVDDQTVITVEHGNTIVRRGPELGRSTVLFPRR